MFCFSQILPCFTFSQFCKSLRMLFICKNFLAILRNSRTCWKSLFPAKENYFIMGTNLSNHSMMSFVWREFSIVWRKMMREVPGVSKAQAWGCPRHPEEILKETQASMLGDAPCMPFFINNHQFVLLCNTLRSSTVITTVISLFMVITVADQAMINLDHSSVSLQPW